MLKPTPAGALAALSLSMLLPSLATSIANVGLPTLAAAFGASFRQAQWIVIAYLLSVTSLVVSAGRLGDMVGRRRLLLGGIALFTAASMLCGAAPTLGTLIAARAVQGIGAAVMMALTLAFVSGTVPEARIGRAMGLLGTMSAMGTALGPALGGLLIAGPGWSAIFLINGPIGVLAFLLALRHLPADPPAKRDGARFDSLGTFLLASSLSAYALAMTLGRDHFGLLNGALLAAAAFGAGLFAMVQARAPSPLIRLAMLRDSGLSMRLAASALVSTVMMATLVVGPFYLTRALGLEPVLVGLILSAGPLAAAATAVAAGRLADRFGTRRTSLAGLGGIAAGCFGLSLVPATLGLPGYIAPMILVTAAYALFQTANNGAVMANLPSDRRGVVAGLLALSRNLGLTTGASAMGAVFAAASGAADVAAAAPEAVAQGMRVTFAIAGILILAMIAPSQRPRIKAL